MSTKLKVDDYVISHADISTKGINISWGANIGFGQLHAYVDPESGFLHFDSECMGKKFITSVFEKLIQNSIVDDFQTVSKTSTPLSFTDLNNLKIAGDKHFLTTPYFYKLNNEETKEFIELFWHAEEDNKKYKVVIKNDLNECLYEDILSYTIKVKNNGFGSEFVSAEIIEYIITDKTK